MPTTRTEQELTKIRHALESIDKSLARIAKALQPAIAVEAPKSE